MALSKQLTITVGKLFSSKFPFLPLVLNKKIKINTQNTIAFSYYSKVRSTQNIGAPCFLCFLENNKWIICVSDEIHSLFKKCSCCSTLFSWNVSFTAELRCLRFSMVQQFSFKLSIWHTFKEATKLWKKIIFYPPQKTQPTF